MKGNDGLVVCLCTGGGFPKNVDSKNLTEEVRNHLVSQLAKELTFYFVKQSLSISFFIKRVTKFEFQSQIKVISDPNTCFFNYISS